MPFLASNIAKTAVGFALRPTVIAFVAGFILGAWLL